MLERSSGEQKFPNAQPEPPLVQPEAITSCPAAGRMGAETNPTSPQSHGVVESSHGVVESSHGVVERHGVVESTQNSRSIREHKLKYFILCSEQGIEDKSTKDEGF